MKNKHKRRSDYGPFTLKNDYIPMAKSGLKVMDWSSLQYAKKEVEQAKKQIAAGEQ